MEWTVVTVLIALFGFGVAVVKPIISLTQSITKLTTVVDAMSTDVSELTTKNSQSHGRMHERMDGHEDLLHEHDKRITVLEKDSGK